MILTQDTINLIITVFYSAIFVYCCISMYKLFINDTW